MGNTALVQYGILEEKSDYRAHVCIAAMTAYVFPTEEGRRAIEGGNHRTARAYQGDHVTAEGLLVPPDDINECQAVGIPEHWLVSLNFSESDSTTDKGEKAVKVVKGMLKKGMIALPLVANQIDDKDMQIEGVDIIVTGRVRIQVKCDYRGGDRRLGGTGNLFLQTKECNPYGLH